VLLHETTNFVVKLFIAQNSSVSKCGKRISNPAYTYRSFCRTFDATVGALL